MISATSTEIRVAHPRISVCLQTEGGQQKRDLSALQKSATTIISRQDFASGTSRHNMAL